MGAKASIQNKRKSWEGNRRWTKDLYNFLSLASEMRALPITILSRKYVDLLLQLIRLRTEGRLVITGNVDLQSESTWKKSQLEKLDSIP